MFTLIIVVVLVVAILGYLKELTPEERAVSTRYASNKLILILVYLARGLKALFQLAWHSGRYAGATMAVESQDMIDHMDTVNQDTADRGGAVRIAIKASKSHAETLGLSGSVASLKSKADEQTALANAKRDERLARAKAREEFRKSRSTQA